MILPFVHASNAFMIIWMSLPFAIRSMAGTFIIIRLLIGGLDLLTTRT